MEPNSEKFETIDAYIAAWPPNVQERLQAIRQVVKEEAPEAVEAISYNMPTFKMGTSLIHFAGAKAHIGVYPTSSHLEEHIPEVAKYRTGKGTLQFPLDEPLPVDLLRQIVALRVRETLEKQARKKKK